MQEIEVILRSHFSCILLDNKYPNVAYDFNIRWIYCTQSIAYSNKLYLKSNVLILIVLNVNIKIIKKTSKAISN